jgi:hypothetical protein
MYFAFILLLIKNNAIVDAMLLFYNVVNRIISHSPFHYELVQNDATKPLLYTNHGYEENTEWHMIL